MDVTSERQRRPRVQPDHRAAVHLRHPCRDLHRLLLNPAEPILVPRRPTLIGRCRVVAVVVAGPVNRAAIVAADEHGTRPQVGREMDSGRHRRPRHDQPVGADRGEIDGAVIKVAGVVEHVTLAGEQRGAGPVASAVAAGDHERHTGTDRLLRILVFLAHRVGAGEAAPRLVDADDDPPCEERRHDMVHRRARRDHPHVLAAMGASE